MALALLPKLLNISCTLTVVHDHLLGWDKITGDWLNGSEDMKCFPYGYDISKSDTIKKSMEESNADGRTAVKGSNYISSTDHGTQYGRMPASHKSKWLHEDSVNSSGVFDNGFTVEKNQGVAKQYAVTIVHIPTQMKLHFKAFITGLSDNFTTRWDSTNALGRMDPIKSFQGTQRVTSISWDVVSANPDEAAANLRKVTNFVKMLYPLQTIRGSATSIKAPPMIAIKFTNLVSQGPKSTNRGLTGTLSGFVFSPIDAAGYFEVDSEALENAAKTGKLGGLDIA
ncbi:MAG TPA: hypothetical protein DEQ32_13545 [Gammaproteobacteria bacterium]|nr:hypothetical protein [Gammaproteobacteria bacterium]|tara:strand:+ start:549 stop:1397 length:849 start_codon:yes stop_codon:yes gene_type:complete